VNRAIAARWRRRVARLGGLPRRAPGRAVGDDDRRAKRREAGDGLDADASRQVIAAQRHEAGAPEERRGPRRQLSDRRTDAELAQQPLEPEGDRRAGRYGRQPAVRQLVGHRREENRVGCRVPIRRGRRRQRV